MVDQHTRNTIREAVARVTRRRDAIRVLDTMPKVRYVFSCYLCGSHNYSLVCLSGGLDPDLLEVCSICGNMGKDDSGWRQELMRREQLRVRRDSQQP